MGDAVKRKLDINYESVGHIEGLEDDLSPAYLKLDARGATVTIPQLGSMGELFTAFHGDSEVVPPFLRYADAQRFYVLGDCSRSGGSVSTNGTGYFRIRARRVIEAGTGMDSYADVDGMTSEVDGLAGWTGMSTVEQSVQYAPAALTVHAENREPILLGGQANATIESSFWFNPRPKGNLFQIEDVALLRTRSDELWPWASHAAAHHMIQDLMCLVYGRACLSRITSIKREDDQPYLRAGDKRRTWREVYEPSFGRSVEGVEPFDRASAVPLFRFKDVDPAALRSWMDEWNLWSRPTWIAVTTMFQRGTTVEAHLLQIGVALEALGYALWQQAGPPTDAKTPSYPDLLERVTSATPVAHDAIFGGATAEDWRTVFNGAFKGTKHADKPLPEGLEAHRLAGQGMNLIRAWLGTRLGVTSDNLRAGFDRAR